ncbi:hypothetical protein [Dietzia cinnamea]|uniref:Excreted virulence factor EspC (Type VII ESX diderm) n=1 Tax=Dietzia cinnamea TaxID=321318 RepID=A0ABV3YFG7_9ACTN|nr:hypothetical protein [Dietzia cinnamea]MCT1639373.1 hypothetical protein [Dietzia cinnamea]MCT1712481.1 hypothetical protein [Dietzia cinnamea]MCT2058658.1 hypothetical protein [Dietzia cinnamea]MCT2061739.1 hypothetical protein [Dietzia cinnamea]MCT2235505.1 hypothetical protein [Dietzia cinnamea]
MAGQDGGTGAVAVGDAAAAAVVAGTTAAAAQGPLGTAVLAFDQVAVTAEATRVREAGRELAEGAVSLSAALEEASAVASAAQAGGVGLLSGGALAECAALLARRSRDLAEETERSADGMARAAGLLTAADEEVAGRVAGAGG